MRVVGDETHSAPVRIVTWDGSEMDVWGKAGEILYKIAKTPAENIIPPDPHEPGVGGGVELDFEPFFILRAQDIFSVMAVGMYLEAINKWGPQDPEMEEGVVEAMNDMKAWQRTHPGRVKYPD